MLALIVLASVAHAQDKLYHDGHHGDYHHRDEGWVWWWFFFALIALFVLVACVFGGYSYGVASTHAHTRGRYEVFDKRGKVVRKVRYEQDTVASSAGDGPVPATAPAAPRFVATASNGFIAPPPSQRQVDAAAAAASQSSPLGGVKLKY